jgi:hypothetical protein
MSHAGGQERLRPPSETVRSTLLGAAVLVAGLVFGALLSSVALCALWWHAIVSSAAGVPGCAWQ